MTLEARLPGLAEWARVRDWRVGQINKMANVAIYRDNRLTAQDVLDVRRGARRARDGLSSGVATASAAATAAASRAWTASNVFTPDDVLRGTLPDGPVLLFDDDCFYIGSVLAEVLPRPGAKSSTSRRTTSCAAWTMNTHEYRHIQKRLRAARRASIITSHNLVVFDGERARIACVYTGAEQQLVVRSVLTITRRLPQRRAATGAACARGRMARCRDRSGHAIGDCLAPGLIAHAVYAGHRYAQELDASVEGEVRFRRR